MKTKTKLKLKNISKTATKTKTKKNKSKRKSHCSDFETGVTGHSRSWELTWIDSPSMINVP